MTPEIKGREKGAVGCNWRISGDSSLTVGLFSAQCLFSLPLHLTAWPSTSFNPSFSSWSPCSGAAYPCASPGPRLPEPAGPGPINVKNSQHWVGFHYHFSCRIFLIISWLFLFTVFLPENCLLMIFLTMEKTDILVSDTLNKKKKFLSNWQRLSAGAAFLIELKCLTGAAALQCTVVSSSSCGNWF